MSFPAEPFSEEERALYDQILAGALGPSATDGRHQEAAKDASDRAAAAIEQRRKDFGGSK